MNSVDQNVCPNKAALLGIRGGLLGLRGGLLELKAGLSWPNGRYLVTGLESVLVTRSFRT